MLQSSYILYLNCDEKQSKKEKISTRNVQVPIIAKKYTTFFYYPLRVYCDVKNAMQISALFIYLICVIFFILF